VLIVKHFPDRPIEQGQYLLALNLYMDISDERPSHYNRWRNQFGYYCDKEHLRCAYLELKRIFQDSGEEA
jgi:hypothetical protein